MQNILEGSKAFSKDLMKKYNIPTAAYETFTSAEEAKKYLETAEYPIVLKADGLALGKGVLICENKEDALAGVDELMLDKKFGTAGDTIVIEEFMTGREVSVLSFVDGNTIKIMSSAQDHKRAKDGDQGLIQAEWVTSHHHLSTLRKLMSSVRNTFIRQLLMQ